MARPNQYVWFHLGSVFFGSVLRGARCTAGSAGVDVQPSPCHVEGLFISIGWFIMKNVTNLEVSFSAVSRPMFVGQVLNSK